MLPSSPDSYCLNTVSCCQDGGDLVSIFPSFSSSVSFFPYLWMILIDRVQAGLSTLTIGCSTS